MNLRFLHPDSKVGALLLFVGALAFQIAYSHATDLTLVDVAGGLTLSCLVWGTAAHYWRSGLSLSLAQGALEAARILGAAAASELVAYLLVGCGLSTVTPARYVALATFAVTYGVAGNYLESRGADDIRPPWADDETALERAIGWVLGAANAVGLVGFLGLVLVGNWLTQEKLADSQLLVPLLVGVDHLNEIPVFGNDFAAALTLVLSGDGNLAFCSVKISSYDELSALVNQHMWLGLFFWAVFLTPTALLILRPVLRSVARRQNASADGVFNGNGGISDLRDATLVRQAFITFQPGIFLALGGVVLALLAQRPGEDTSYPESCATVILTAGLYVASYVRSARLMAAAYQGAGEARLRLGLEMLTTGILGIPAFLIFGHYVLGDEGNAYTALVTVMTLFALLQLSAGTRLLRSHRLGR